MSELKFRAWSSRVKIGLPHMVYLDPRATAFSGGDLIEDDDWKVMQFTGLKDKHGKEIYEGDIVVLSHMQSAPTGVVRWFQESACFVATEKPDQFAGHNLFPDTDEVIGNIYENPEFLTA